MDNKEVYVLVENNPDYVNIMVYKEMDNAMSALKELAKENDMEYYEGDNEAHGEDTYVEVRTEILN
jgi:hypothetical protein